MSLLSLRVIVILLSCFSVSARVSAFFIFLCDGIFLNNYSLRWLCKLFDKTLVVALARAALAMCLQSLLHLLLPPTFIIISYILWLVVSICNPNCSICFNSFTLLALFFQNIFPFPIIHLLDFTHNFFI
jgi:hypothetical protein